MNTDFWEDDPSLDVWIEQPSILFEAASARRHQHAVLDYGCLSSNPSRKDMLKPADAVTPLLRYRVRIMKAEAGGLTEDVCPH